MVVVVAVVEHLWRSVVVVMTVAYPRSSWSSCIPAEFFPDSTAAYTQHLRRSCWSETRLNPPSNPDFLRHSPHEAPTSKCHPQDKYHEYPNSIQRSWQCSRQSEERLRSCSEWSCSFPGSLRMCHLVTCHQESRS